MQAEHKLQQSKLGKLNATIQKDQREEQAREHERCGVLAQPGVHPHPVQDEHAGADGQIGHQT